MKSRHKKLTARTEARAAWRRIASQVRSGQIEVSPGLRENAAREHAMRKTFRGIMPRGTAQTIANPGRRR